MALASETWPFPSMSVWSCCCSSSFRCSSSFLVVYSAWPPNSLMASTSCVLFMLLTLGMLKRHRRGSRAWFKGNSVSGSGNISLTLLSACTQVCSLHWRSGLCTPDAIPVPATLSSPFCCMTGAVRGRRSCPYSSRRTRSCKLSIAFFRGYEWS